MTSTKIDFFVCLIYLFIWVSASGVPLTCATYVPWQHNNLLEINTVHHVVCVKLIVSGVETDKDDAIVEKTECQTEKLGSKYNEYPSSNAQRAFF